MRALAEPIGIYRNLPACRVRARTHLLRLSNAVMVRRCVQARTLLSSCPHRARVSARKFVVARAALVVPPHTLLGSPATQIRLRDRWSVWRSWSDGPTRRLAIRTLGRVGRPRRPQRWRIESSPFRHCVVCDVPLSVGLFPARNNDLLTSEFAHVGN